MNDIGMVVKGIVLVVGWLSGWLAGQIQILRVHFLGQSWGTGRTKWRYRAEGTLLRRVRQAMRWTPYTKAEGQMMLT